MNHVPQHINPLQWHQALGYARQACARIFRDGGSPRDALQAFGVSPPAGIDWSKTVELVAQELCVQPMRKAA
jgi:hypothetical protein